MTGTVSSPKSEAFGKLADLPVDSNLGEPAQGAKQLPEPVYLVDGEESADDQPPTGVMMHLMEDWQMGLESMTETEDIPPKEITSNLAAACRTGSLLSEGDKEYQATLDTESKTGEAMRNSDQKADTSSTLSRQMDTEVASKIKSLFSKKESDNATSLLQGKNDLMGCIAECDCVFLGKNFWIFTLTQLVAVLETDKVAHSRSVDTEKAREASNVRDKIIEALVQDSKMRTETSDLHSKGREADFTQIEMAHTKLASWNDAIRQYKIKKKSDVEQIRSQFHLDGPIKTLFPAGTRNFLKSIMMESLWDFLAIKKTENSAVCSMMGMWRQKCGLSTKSKQALAKHLIGVSLRVEAALSAIPCVSQKDRVWMNDAMICMTGSSHDFIVVDRGIFLVSDFLAQSTKDMAIALEIWRQKKGFEPLKGSGKVANISAWKSQAKDAMETEADIGMIVNINWIVLDRNKSLGSSAELPTHVAAEQKKKKRRKSASPLDNGDGKVENMLHSKSFLEVSLGKQVAALILKAQINTAMELFNAKTSIDSILYRIVIASGRARSFQSFNEVLHTWRNKLKADLERNGQSGIPDFERNSAPSFPSMPRSQIEAKRDEIMGSLDDKEAGNNQNPFDALSKTSKKFLSSININNAVDFLTARTTDISAEFVIWRAVEGKSELRGLGAIASVSGWKAAVRSKAKELGFNDLAELEPKNKATWNADREKFKRKREISEAPDEYFESQTSTESKANTLPLTATDDTLPPGKGLQEDRKKLFAVQHRDLDAHFVFLLSLRNHSFGSNTVYITYRGFGSRSNIVESASKIDIDYQHTIPGDVTARSGWVLADVAVNRNAIPLSSIDLRAPFSTFLQGCGFIDIGRHGARPYMVQDLAPLKYIIEMYVLSGIRQPASTPISTNVSDSYNVLIVKTSHDEFKYLLHLKDPIERGQTVCVRFPTITCVLGLEKYTGTKCRTMHEIDEATRVLSLNDLRSLLSWLVEEVLRSTKYEGDQFVQDPQDAFLVACERRRRLCWVSRRIASAIGDGTLSTKDTELLQLLEFGRTTKNVEEWHLLSKCQQHSFAQGVQEAIALEIEYALELDVACGLSSQSVWCPKSCNLLRATVEIFLKHYLPMNLDREDTLNSVESHKEFWSSLKPFLLKHNSTIQWKDKDSLRDFVMNQPSFISDDGRVIATAESKDLSCKGRYSQSDESIDDDKGLVACIKNDDMTRKLLFSFELRKQVDVHSGKALLSSDWYRTHFWRIFVVAISAFKTTLSSLEAETFQLASIMNSASLILVDRADCLTYPMTLIYKNIVCIPQFVANEYALASQPFFFGIVWPTLRNVGWRLEAGHTSSELIFHPKNDKSRHHSISLKRRRDRQKLVLAREIMEASQENVNKATKRLLIATIGETASKDGEFVSDSPEFKVADILRKFEHFALDKLLEKGAKTVANVSPIVNSVRNCFDALADRLTPTQGIKGKSDDQTLGRRPVDVYSCEYLMQFLLLIADIFKQADTSAEERRDCMEILHDLLRYISANHRQFFSKNFHTSLEYYVGAAENLMSAPLYLELKASHGDEKSLDAHQSGSMTELITEQEKQSVTEFIACVMEEAIPCLASEEDIKRKNRKVGIGFAGICCRHCLGMHGEGRYFFSSLESLSTSYTGLEKHYLRCPSVSPEIKGKVVKTRSLHAQQRANLRQGSQQAFFNSMWYRLHNSNIPKLSGTSMSPISQAYEGDENEPTNGSDVAISDHIAVLDYIRKNRVNAEVDEAVDQYYDCLDYAGRVYNTSSMPQHFSSEWLLAKVHPKRRHQTYSNVG